MQIAGDHAAVLVVGHDDIARIVRQLLVRHGVGVRVAACTQFDKLILRRYVNEFRLGVKLLLPQTLLHTDQIRHGDGKKDQQYGDGKQHFREGEACFPFV